MAIPRAIYASVPPDHPGHPNWDSINGVSPVEYSLPFHNWPDLNWTGDPIEENGPTEYNLERAKYLWSHPLVQDPVQGESYIFIRQWTIGTPGGQFDGQTMPADNLILTIMHAADNEYAMALVVDTEDTQIPQSPIGANKYIPSSEDTWRNIKSYLYHLDLTGAQPGTKIRLISEVINFPQTQGIVETNPAMFTWVMQVYNYS